MTGMTGPRDPDARIAAFFQASQPDLPDRTFDAVRYDIGRTRQLVVVGPLRLPGAPPSQWATVAAAAVVAVAVLFLDLRLGGGPFGGPGVTPTPAAPPSPSPSTVATTPAPLPSGPTTFSSPLYGYTITVPAGWVPAQAFLRWDGLSQPGPDADADKFDGPDELTLWAFAGPIDGDLDAFVADRIAATARDHADTCPVGKPETNEPLRIGGRDWVLIGWNCGALINMAVTVENGVGYSFNFRDLAIQVATDPTDRALFLSILDSVEFPS